MEGVPWAVRKGFLEEVTLGLRRSGQESWAEGSLCKGPGVELILSVGDWSGQSSKAGGR